MDEVQRFKKTWQSREYFNWCVRRSRNAGYSQAGNVESEWNDVKMLNESVIFGKIPPRAKSGRDDNGTMGNLSRRKQIGVGLYKPVKNAATLSRRDRCRNGHSREN
mgnify:CR=1 FL=1